MEKYYKPKIEVLSLDISENISVTTSGIDNDGSYLPGWNA